MPIDIYKNIKSYRVREVFENTSHIDIEASSLNVSV